MIASAAEIAALKRTVLADPTDDGAKLALADVTEDADLARGLRWCGMNHKWPMQHTWLRRHHAAWISVPDLDHSAEISRAMFAQLFDVEGERQPKELYAYNHSVAPDEWIAVRRLGKVLAVMENKE